MNDDKKTTQGPVFRFLIIKQWKQYCASDPPPSTLYHCSTAEFLWELHSGFLYPETQRALHSAPPPSSWLTLNHCSTAEFLWDLHSGFLYPETHKRPTLFSPYHGQGLETWNPGKTTFPRPSTLSLSHECLAQFHYLQSLTITRNRCLTQLDLWLDLQ